MATATMAPTMGPKRRCVTNQKGLSSRRGQSWRGVILKKRATMISGGVSSTISLPCHASGMEMA